MTTRERLKLRLKVAARNAVPVPDTWERFKKSSFETLGCLDDAEMNAEIDRLDNLRFGHGLGRLVKEVWNEVEADRLEDERLARYNALVKKNNV